MASSDGLADFLEQVSKHWQDARPLVPMYIHLIASALFPIYTGAHASLSRPSSAAKADKKRRRGREDDDDEDDEKVQQMEGLSNKDAIILPVTAGIVLAGLYFLIMRYGADLINLILGWYFSGVGLYSVTQLINDGLNFALGFMLPNYYASGRMLWYVSNDDQKASREDGKDTRDNPLPSFLSLIPLPPVVKSGLWSLRSSVRQKYTLKAFIESTVDLRLKITIINVLSAALGVGTIIYVNTVSKPWFLTNLQGFAVSYSALQLMSPTTFPTGSTILGALFCYDIWAVFFTPLMVTVAKNLDQPIKLVFPRPDEASTTPGEPPIRSYSMLGLGDIVLPGIMIGLALRFDLYLVYLKKQISTQRTVANANGEKTTGEQIDKAPYVSVSGRWGDRFWTLLLPKSALPARLHTSFPKPYFTASMIGYVVGMLTTLGVMSVFQHAQPALLYLVPGVLISLWSTALVRGEVKEMWEFSEAITGEPLEDSESNKDDEDAKKDQGGLFERLWREIWPFGGSKEEKVEDKSKLQSEKPIKDREASKTDEKLQRDGVLFSVELSRYDPSHDDAVNSDKDGQAVDDASSNDTATATSVDVSGDAEPRRRTRALRSSAK